MQAPIHVCPPFLPGTIYLGNFCLVKFCVQIKGVNFIREPVLNSRTKKNQVKLAVRGIVLPNFNLSILETVRPEFISKSWRHLD